MQFVHRVDPRDFINTLTHGVKRDVGGHTLHEDVRRRLDEGKGGGEDDAGDDKGDTWVEVESPSALAASSGC